MKLLIVMVVLSVAYKSESISRIKSMTQWNRKIMNNPNPVYVIFYDSLVHNQFYDVANALNDYTCSTPLFTKDDEPACVPRIFTVNKHDQNMKDLSLLKDVKGNIEAMAFKNGKKIGKTVVGYNMNGRSVPYEHKNLLDLAVGREINNEYRWPKVFI